MRFALALCCLLVVAPVTHAAGLNLAWDQCLSDGGSAAKKFACNTNAGFEYLYGSFIPGQNHPQFCGCLYYVDIQAETATLPSWWQFYWSESCRPTALGMTFDFTSLTTQSCNDPFNGTAVGGIANYVVGTHTRPDFTPRANAARIYAAAAVLPYPTITPGTEYLGFRLAISHQSTVGGGACAGCATAVCITFTQCDVVDDKPLGAPERVERLTQQATSNMASWQDAGPSCQSAVKNKTWGQLKSLYR